MQRLPLPLASAVVAALLAGCGENKTIEVHRFVATTGSSIRVVHGFGQLTDDAPSKVAHYVELKLDTDIKLRAPSTGAIKFYTDLDGIPNSLVLEPKKRAQGLDHTKLDSHLPQPANLRIVLGNLESSTLRVDIVELEKLLRPDLTDPVAGTEADAFLAVDIANPPAEIDWPKLSVYADPEVTSEGKTWTQLGEAAGDRLRVAAYEWKDADADGVEEAGERLYVNPAPYLALITDDPAQFQIQLRAPELAEIRLETAEDAFFSSGVTAYAFPDLATGSMSPDDTLTGFMRVFFRLKSGPVDGGDDVVAPYEIAYELRRVDGALDVRSHGRFRFNTWPLIAPETVSAAAERLGETLYRAPGSITTPAAPLSDPDPAVQQLWVYLPFSLEEVVGPDAPLSDLAVRSVMTQDLSLAAQASDGDLLPFGSYELDIALSSAFGTAVDKKTCKFKIAPDLVEIQINKTPEATDDYITWAPTFCRARAAASSAMGATVVLTNDAAGADGQLLFDPSVTPWPVNTTATSSTLSLTLPADGSWVEFVIAGEFDHPSKNDRDAVIVVHQSSAGGTELAQHALMVRVRKNANDLEAAERDRFLQALRQFRDQPTGGYLMFQEMHRLASSIANDQAHGQPSFFPWHRAMVLQVERELQAIDPSVALPYWNWEAPAPNVFTADFMGEGDPAVTRGSASSFAEPNFALSNPLDGWDTDLTFGFGRVRRLVFDWTEAPVSYYTLLDGGGLTDLVDRVDFGPFADPALSFASAAELEAHNPAHGWMCGSGLLADEARAAADPLFYLLHSQVDRQWAYWQQKNDRLGTVVAGALSFPAPAHYDNAGTFTAVGATGQQGSYLEDGMWPWDGDTDSAQGDSPRGDRPENQATIAQLGNPDVTQSRPAVPTTPFPASRIASLWPSVAIAVEVRHMIDYLGRHTPANGLGFCYDDVPYK